MLTRREALRRSATIAAAVAGGQLLAPYLARSAFGKQAAQLPPPETTTIRVGVLPCDHPIMASEAFLQQEGFTRVELLAGRQLASVDIDVGFPIDVAQYLEGGQRVVAFAGLHAGCAEVWAQPGINSLQDLRGRALVVQSRAIGNFAYSYTAIVLKNAGVDPSQVNWVVQPNANPTALFLEGKNEAVFAAQAGTAALHANPANRGHVIHSQLMERPWSTLACCLLIAKQEWYRTNPVAAKRAVRAILRAADAQTPSRAEAVKRITDRGLFGGPSSFDNVLYAASMVPANWRDLDMERSLRFYAQLLADVGLLKVSVDDVVQTADSRILEEVQAELRRS
ncbi:MAG TPA: ABC transporter substrate-binding protein [bacterium]|jgi:NitT/TauT family transport system substrate-binding protein|nr:ABC transporter substrate-binding protein [bacterium]